MASTITLPGTQAATTIPHPSAALQPQRRPVADLHLSKEGRAFIVQREKLIDHYYNDQGGHCTYGIGTLVRYAGCTKEELAIKKIPEDQIDKALDAEIVEREVQVRDGVGKQDLTQMEFDALVSLVYNAGAFGASPILTRIKDEGPANVASLILTSRIKVSETGKDGKLHLVVSKGLVNRRHAEAMLFKGGGYSTQSAVKAVSQVKPRATKDHTKMLSRAANRGPK